MDLSKKILDKGEINSRFVMAVYAILKNKLVNSKADLAESLDIKASKFSEILNGRMNAGIDVIAKMCDLYRISPDWILMSRGDNMFRDSYSMPRIWVDDEPSCLNTEPPCSEKPSNASTENVAVKATNPSEGIPLIPLSAMAGNFSAEQTVLEYECERYVVPIFKGADFLIPVKGSSMVPHYNSGDVVACRRVPMTNLFFQWNKVYVIDTDQGAIIKRLKPGSDGNHVKIVSDNPNFDPFELPLECIHSVALVIGTIRLE